MPERALVLDTGKHTLHQALRSFPDLEIVQLRDSDVQNADGKPIGFQAEAKTLAYIDGLMAERPFGAVLASSESQMQFAGLLRSRYGLSGLNYDQAAIVSNKWRMRQALSPTIPCPDYWLSGNFRALRHQALWASVPEWVVIKPLYGSSSKGVRRLQKGQALQYLEGIRQLCLVETAIDMDSEWHCDGIISGGILQVHYLSRYSRPVLTAAGDTRASLHMSAGHPDLAACDAFVRRVLDALSFPDGVFHLEFYRCGDTCILGEIGLRPAGGGIAQSIRHFFGTDLWDSFIRLQLGKPIGKLTKLQRSDICGVIGFVAHPDRIPRSQLSSLPGVEAVMAGKSSDETVQGADPSSAFTDLLLCSFEEESHFLHLVDQLSAYIKGGL